MRYTQKWYIDSEAFLSKNRLLIENLTYYITDQVKSQEVFIKKFLSVKFIIFYTSQISDVAVWVHPNKKSAEPFTL